MKINTKIYTVSALMLSMGLVGCNDLDTQPQDNYVTTLEKEEAIKAQPDLASAGVVGISSTATAYASVYNNHFDFGWPAVLMFFDSAGLDMVSPNNGYNWFSYGAQYALGTATNIPTNMAWYHAYKLIKTCNDVIANIDPETTDPQLQLYAAQGYANRAYLYFTLAQLYQQTYVGHETLPCVPVLTNLNSNEAASNGAPRATVAEVYEQIMADINLAIKMLSESGLSVSNIASVGTKRFVSLGAAYGIRARINLVMNNWQDAADDAEKAIQYSGATPYSIAEASKPAFWNSDDHNCMWAIYIQETDRVVTTGICNYPSMMGSFNENGYWYVGAFRMINKALYNTIPATDCRKGWWLDESGISKNLTAEQQAFVSSAAPDPRTQVKFGAYQDNVGTTTNANDYFLMRVEEMILTQAEATAMAGNPTAGKQILEDFVKTYRNPEYKCTATSATAIQEEIWNQRRIELWGEGIGYFDLLRLNKGMDRRGGGWPAAWVYNVEAPLKPLLIPQGEMEANPAIGANNTPWNRPTMVSDN